MLRKIIKNFIGNAGTTNLINRQMWVKSALLDLPAGSRILDGGAGESQYQIYCDHLDYVSQDFKQYKGYGNHEGIQTGTWNTSKIDIVSDIVSIPMPNASFDAVLCTEVFEHIPDPISAMKEFHRLLKPKGELILSAPFCSLSHLAPYHYYGGFNKYFYQYHLTEIGFTIVEVTSNGDYSEYLAQELQRLKTIYGRSPLYMKICVALLLRFINLNRFSHETGHLGCFGFHVRAVKN